MAVSYAEPAGLRAGNSRVIRRVAQAILCAIVHVQCAGFTTKRHSRAKSFFLANVCLSAIKLGRIGPKSRHCHETLEGLDVTRAVFLLVLFAVTGCAQLQPASTAQVDKLPVPKEIMRFDIPADALGARDQQLSAVLAKAGALAAVQKQQTVIRVTALGQDLPYINQAIWKGVPPETPMKPTLENLTAGASQTYSVSIKPLQPGG